jgi:hypothetical protein
MGVGLRWLLHLKATRFQEAPDHLNIRPPGQSGTVILQRLEAEMDEFWSFVGAKQNRYWVWIALDGVCEVTWCSRLMVQNESVQCK